jgi:ABC-type multidrug transport system fused ATPase/permease subunit
LHTHRKKDLLSCQISLGTIAEGKHPVSIPNPAVKPSSADDTVPGERHGKVGRPGGLYYTYSPMYDHIVIKGARQHNLKNIDLKIPKNKLIVITGPSGSGKSSLAFDTIYAEGQRRYVKGLWRKAC